MKKSYLLSESLSVMIPAYREEGNIERVVNLALNHVKQLAKDFEIIVVDDGSPDKTGEIIDRMAKKNKHIRPVHHKTNLGLGRALRTGVNSCKKDIIIYIEGDGQSLLKDQRKLLEKIKTADVVLGSRSSRVDYSLFRKIMSWAYINLVNLTFGLSFEDYNWSQAYRRKIFRTLKMKSETPFFTTEVVVKALRSGYNVTEAPTRYRPRGSGTTSLGNLKTAYGMFKEMLLLRYGNL